ncbi:hypothetical protein ACLMJK_004570 [Lecanora helva]
MSTPRPWDFPHREPGGSTITETLSPSLLPHNYHTLRRQTPRIGTAPPTAWTPIVDHPRRLDQERALYLSYITRGAHLPPLSSYENEELSQKQLDALFNEMERRGILDDVFGGERKEMGLRSGKVVVGREGVSRREMWELVRDLGFGFAARYARIEGADGGEWTRAVWVPGEGREGRRVPWWVGTGRPSWMGWRGESEDEEDDE